MLNNLIACRGVCAYTSGEGDNRAMAETHIGESYRQKRLWHWLSQGDAAEKARINRSKLCLFERGSIDLSEKELKRLDKLYGADKVPLRSLIGYGPDEPRTESQRRKLRRQRADVSQSELAKLTGISQTRLSRWETERATLAPEEEALIEKTLDEVIERASHRDPYRVALASDEDAEYLFNQWKASRREADRNFFQTQVARLEHSSSLDDPIVQEVIASLRREIAKLEEQRAEQPHRPAESEKAGD
jgi:transcriptional regulator with XRE-family HTH domain